MNIDEKDLNVGLGIETVENNENGITISEEVISIISSVAAKSVKGVFGMYTSISGGFAEFLGKKNQSKGVKVLIDGNTCVIDVYIVVEYGTVIPDISWEIQDKVKNDVEAMTGLNVKAVNVNVEGVNVIKPKEETEKAEEKAKSSTENTEEKND